MSFDNSFTNSSVTCPFHELECQGCAGSLQISALSKGLELRTLRTSQPEALDHPGQFTCLSTVPKWVLSTETVHVQPQ